MLHVHPSSSSSMIRPHVTCAATRVGAKGGCCCRTNGRSRITQLVSFPRRDRKKSFRRLQGTMDQWLEITSRSVPDNVSTSSSGQLAPQDSVSSVRPLEDSLCSTGSRNGLCSPLPSSMQISPVWRYSRQPNSTEPKRTKSHQRIWYCKSRDCLYHTYNLDNAESHLRVKHHILLESSDSRRSQNIRFLIDQQQKRKADSALGDERFDNQLRSIVHCAAVRRAIAELVARRNLPYSCVEWPELHALILSFNYAAVSLLLRSHVSVARLITAQYHACRSGLRKELPCARSKIHLTDDSWTSPNKLEFQAVTCHFVASEGILKKALPAFQSFGEGIMAAR
jgi:hypothetical protein